jgi:CPA1 family monovalent cation:H+ antiporter
MRGAVSLAAALAVPLSVGARPQIIFVTFALILITLVGQGLSLPFVIRKLRLEEPRRWSDEEAVARMEAAQAALDRLDELEAEDWARDEPVERLRDMYSFRRGKLKARTDDAPRLDRHHRDYQRLRRELLGAERDALLELRRRGELDDAVMQRVQRELDIEETRLDG